MAVTRSDPVRSRPLEPRTHRRGNAARLRVRGSRLGSNSERDPRHVRSNLRDLFSNSGDLPSDLAELLAHAAEVLTNLPPELRQLLLEFTPLAASEPSQPQADQSDHRRVDHRLRDLHPFSFDS